MLLPPPANRGRPGLIGAQLHRIPHCPLRQVFVKPCRYCSLGIGVRVLLAPKGDMLAFTRATGRQWDICVMEADREQIIKELKAR